MAGFSGLTSIWNNIKEIDLRPLREEALDVPRLAIVGAPGSGRAALANAMRQDPARPQGKTETPVLILPYEQADQARKADLVIVLVRSEAGDYEQPRRTARALADAGRVVLVVVHTGAGSGEEERSWMEWSGKQILYGAADEEEFLLHELSPRIMELLPDQLISLGRHFPLFRMPIVVRTIHDTSLSNGAYALSTGLAEIIPALGVPLNVADLVVLTKAQAFLVYKLGLTLGLSTQWQDYVSEFGSVLGGGFLWRQVARSLVGLIPAWGIIPKVAVAYAGTYVVGNVVLQWYLTGRHISGKQMRELYAEAFTTGKQLARNMVSRMPRPRVGRRKRAQLTAGPELMLCPECGRPNAPDALFCQYCGRPQPGLVRDVDLPEA
jgi:uncharacterized protein (DUF697 family)